MSMSQEEIEALMSGLDIQEDEASEVEEQDVPAETIEETEDENATMSEDDIADLIAQTDMPEEETEPAPVVEEVAEAEEEISEETVDEIINNIEETPEPAEEPEEENIDDILAGIEGMTESEPVAEEKETAVEDADKEAIAKDWTDTKIDEGIFPLPVEKNTKVVNQLSQVANDSEEKASKIFDVLSFILDENNEIQKGSKNLDEFVGKQIVLLEALCKKFPNVAAFKTNLELAQSLQGIPKDIVGKVDAENMQLFEAMELMQFHDINRQKIERVMSVIKKLSTYLNNLFEDETGYHDVATAKHIHGDVNNDLVDDSDLDALIAEFGN